VPPLNGRAAFGVSHHATALLVAAFPHAVVLAAVRKLLYAFSRPFTFFELP